ncbi:MAG: DUF362 domain-containing protein [Anaerolineae bacterium]|nr:DUF362 domain-containing protein [Anaerolineae bacterium]MDW8070096.1 DUF362 domain-containing protein [Anaerolineae bacterium]
MASRVSLVRGEERRQNILAALDAIAADVEPLLQVDAILVKPNLVCADNPLAVTHVDAVRAVLDWLRQRTDVPILVADGTALSSTWEAFQRNGYQTLPKEYRAVRLVDLNTDEPVTLSAFDWRLRPRPLEASRIAVQSRLRISLAIPKTHDVVLVTLGLKNMIMGSLISRLASTDHHAGTPRASWTGQIIHAAERMYLALPAVIRNSPFIAQMKELFFGNVGRSSKAAVHQGFPVIHLNLFTLAKHLYPHLTVLDGFEAMEGNGPSDGEAVPWRIALASTDWLAADVTAARLMGFALEEVGYLWYCAQAGYGAWRESDVTLVGNVSPEQVYRRFKRHALGDVQNRWHSPAVQRQVELSLAMLR